MKNKRLLIFAFIISAFLISGCRGVADETRIGGVDIAFLEDRPPRDVIYENQDFTVGIKLINNIPDEINGAKICVKDLPADSFGGIQGEDCRDVSLPAAISFEDKVEPYEAESLYFSAEPYTNLDRGVDDTTIFATLTYPLKTKSDVEICLAKDSESSDEFKCESRSVFSGKNIRSDFAPLIVERIESHIVPEGGQNRIRLDIYFKKSPVGKLIDPESNKERFKVDLSFGSTSSSFQCNPLINGMVEMKETTKKITCYSLVDLDSSYVDTLNIDLSYSYETMIYIEDIKLEKVFKEEDL